MRFPDLPATRRLTGDPSLSKGLPGRHLSSESCPLSLACVSPLGDPCLPPGPCMGVGRGLPVSPSPTPARVSPLAAADSGTDLDLRVAPWSHPYLPSCVRLGCRLPIGPYPRLVHSLRVAPDRPRVSPPSRWRRPQQRTPRVTCTLSPRVHPSCHPLDNPHSPVEPVRGVPPRAARYPAAEFGTAVTPPDHRILPVDPHRSHPQSECCSATEPEMRLTR